MFSSTAFKSHQHRWAAELRGMEVSPKSYLSSVNDNLYQHLSGCAQCAFERGNGQELRDTIYRPAKMRALHSSSALAVNVFDYWSLHDKSPLANALDLAEPINKLGFEYKPCLPTGTTPPNLDVTLYQTGSKVIAIESKLCEWTRSSKKKGVSFSSPYFSDKKVWSDCGLPKSQMLAESIQVQDEWAHYSCLDVPQLLKHALGLAHMHGKEFELWYLYFDFSDSRSLEHRAEIERFQDSVGSEMRFRSLTYQELFSRIKDECGCRHQDYIKYLEQRYFPL